MDCSFFLIVVNDRNQININEKILTLGQRALKHKQLTVNNKRTKTVLGAEIIGETKQTSECRTVANCCLQY